MSTSTLSMQVLLAVLACTALETCASGVNVDVSVGLTKQAAFSNFAHYWKRSFGSGHAFLSIREDWQAHLKQAVEDLELGGVRFHGIFDDDMGPVVPHPSTLKTLEYNWTLIDKTWDYQISLCVVPLVELSFMACVLANCKWKCFCAQVLSKLAPVKSTISNCC